MDLSRAKELSKTVPVAEFSLGDIVKMGQEFGIIVKIQAWEGNNPPHIYYSVQFRDPGPVELDDGNVWDVFNGTASCTRSYLKPEELELVFSPRSDPSINAGLKPA
mgnify:CR=1 FL=1